MKPKDAVRWMLIVLLLPAILRAADLPTITVEHLYYLEARGVRVRDFKINEVIEYSLVQKLGGPGFDSLYSQLVTIRLELAKLHVEEVTVTDPRIVVLNKTQEEYSKLLREEAQKIQNGIIREATSSFDSARRSYSPPARFAVRRLRSPAVNNFGSPILGSLGLKR